MLTDLLDRKAGQRKSQAARKLTSKCLNLNDETGGKSGLYARLVAAPQGPAVAQGRNASASCSRFGEGIEAGRDDIIGQPLISEKDNLRADDITIR